MDEILNGELNQLMIWMKFIRVYLLIPLAIHITDKEVNYCWDPSFEIILN